MTGATKVTKRRYEATINERGNGLADVGDYVAGQDGNVYRVVSTGGIHAGGTGAGRYMYAVVELADWDAVGDDEEPECGAVVDVGDDEELDQSR